MMETNKIRACALFMIAALLLVVSAWAVEKTGLLAKWDFEEIGLKGWTLDAPSKDFVFALEKDSVHSGKACVRMEKLQDASSRPGYAYANIKIPQGSGFNSVKMQLFVRTKGLSDGEAVIRILLHREGKVIDMIPMSRNGKEPFIALPASEQWVQVKGTGVVPRDIDSLTVIVASTVGKGIVWLDDISVEGSVEEADANQNTDKKQDAGK